jgi:putative oxidoreductase
MTFESKYLYILIPFELKLGFTRQKQPNCLDVFTNYVTIQYGILSLLKEGLIMADLGLLIIRLVVGLTFIGHGAQKLFGWFGGPGLANTGEWLESIGIKPGGKIWAICAGTFELVGGFFFAAGFLTWIGAGLIAIIMIDAIFTVHGRNGYWAQEGGFEYNFVLIAVVIGVALIGPGQYVLFYTL